MKIKQIACVAALLALAGCASNGQDSKVDHGDGVETPDVLLQDTEGKSVQYGDRDYGLAKDAKKHDQQIKPDPLVAGIDNGHTTRRTSSETTVTQAQPQSVAPTVTSKPKPKAQPTVSKQQGEEQRLKRDSSLEVEDPLLGEVDPG